jgi:AraC-like DNA-binding protein
MASGVMPGPSGILAEDVTSEHRIRAFALSGLREHLKSYGTELGPLLNEAELSADTIKDDYAWVPLRKFANVLTFAARDTGDPYLGLKYWAAARFTSNPLGYLMANAPDLRTALRSFARFHPVLNSNTLRFVETPAGGGRIEWSYPISLPNTVQLTDFSLMRFVSRIQGIAGGTWRPLAVAMMHRAPLDLSEYERRFGSRLAFDQPANAIAIAASTLSLATPRADPQLFKLVMRFCEDQLQRQQGIEHPLNRIREAMTRCLQQGSFRPTNVARELGIAPALLLRHLKANHTSFQRLLDDTRRSLTKRYLLETSLKLTEIAGLVGYSELSAFSRAARRWFGTSPRSFRRQAPNLDAAA